mgnify:CR=1 FL=1
MGYDPYGTFDLWEFFRGVGNIVTGALAIGAGAIVLIGGPNWNVNRCWNNSGRWSANFK